MQTTLIREQSTRPTTAIVKAVKYRNEKHRAVFIAAARKMNRDDRVLMSAMYLLTADHKLWQAAKRFVKGNRIPLKRIRLKGITETGYTLFCCAKDLMYGTEYLTARDLADRELIPPQILKVIGNAIKIKRHGLAAIGFEEDKI